MGNRGKAETFIGFAIRSNKYRTGQNTCETLKKAYLFLLCNTASENAKKQAIKTSDTTIYSRQKQSVIEYLTREIQADCKTIAELLGISSPRARAVLTKMVKEEIVVTEGGNRNRTYKLKS